MKTERDRKRQRETERGRQKETERQKGLDETSRVSEVFTSGIDDHLSPNPSSYLYTIGSVLFLSLTQIFLSFPFSFVLSLLPLLPLSISYGIDNSSKMKTLHFYFVFMKINDAH